MPKGTPKNVSFAEAEIIATEELAIDHQEHALELDQTDNLDDQEFELANEENEDGLVRIPPLPAGHSSELTAVLNFLDEYNALTNDEKNTPIVWLINFFAAHPDDGAALIQRFIEADPTPQHDAFVSLLLEKSGAISLQGVINALLVAAEIAKEATVAASTKISLTQQFKAFIENSAIYASTRAADIQSEQYLRDMEAMEAAENPGIPAQKTDFNVAMEDIDGCLVIEKNGEKILNPALIAHLQQGDYQQIILFTQRSKFMRYEDCFKHDPLDPEKSPPTALSTTPEIVDALTRSLRAALGKNVDKIIQVSTSVDAVFGQALAYYPQLADFERDYQKLRSEYQQGDIDQATYLAEERVFKIDVLQELQDIARSLSPDDIQEMAKLVAANAGRSISADRKTQIAESETARLTDLQNAINAETLTTLKAKSPAELDACISTWKAFHPTQKVKQNQHLDAFLASNATSIKKTYHDDIYANISEIIASNPDIPLQAVIVKGETLTPLPQHLKKEITSLLSVVPDGMVLARENTSFRGFFRTAEKTQTHYQEKLESAMQLLAKQPDFSSQLQNIQIAQEFIKGTIPNLLAAMLNPTELAQVSTTTKIHQSACYDMNQHVQHAFRLALLDAYHKGPPEALDTEKLTTDFKTKCTPLFKIEFMETAIEKAKVAVANFGSIPTDQTELQKFCQMLSLVENPPARRASVDMKADEDPLELLKSHLDNSLNAEQFYKQEGNHELFDRFETLASRQEDIDSQQAPDNASPHELLKDLLAAHFCPQKLAIVTDLKLHEAMEFHALEPEHAEHVTHLFHASHSLLEGLDEHHREHLHDLLPPSAATDAIMSSTSNNTVRAHLSKHELPHAELAAKLTLFVVANKL